VVDWPLLELTRHLCAPRLVDVDEALRPVPAGSRISKLAKAVVASTGPSRELRMIVFTVVLPSLRSRNSPVGER
jgi:hypothetical protein